MKDSVAFITDGSPVAGAIPLMAGMPYALCFATSLLGEYRARSLREDLRDGHYSLVLNKLFLSLNTWVERHVLKKARFIIGISPYVGRSLGELYGIEEDKVAYLPFPIASQPRMANKVFNPKGPRLLAVGRVDDRRKNYPFLLRTFKLMSQRFPESRLRIAGTISPASRLLDIRAELGLDSSVDFLGSIPAQELKREFEQADIFVLSPRQEGLGIVYLEAMSYGVPAVTTRCGGPEGIIVNGFNGYLVRQDDPQAFCDAVAKVWQSEEFYRWLSQRAHTFIKEVHAPEIFHKRLMDILQEKLI